MKPQNQDFRELAVKYLAGECNAEEVAKLHQWKEQSDENKVIFDQYRKLWHLQSSAAGVRFDAVEAWKKVESRLSPKANSAVSGSGLPKRYRIAVLAVAAALALLFGFYLIFQHPTQPNQLHYSAHTNPETMILPDSSQVFLNSGSQLTLNENFSGDTRRVLLNGEAFFVIKHNAKKPFIVSIGDTEVKVLGTSFNVAERHNRNLIDVAVLTGSVVFSSSKNQNHKILLAAGEMGVFDRVEGTLHKAVLEDKNFMAWRTGVLEFENTPLNIVLMTLEKNYKISIETPSNISGLKLTARFNNEKPEDIFKTLQLVFGFEVEQHGQTYILR